VEPLLEKYGLDPVKYEASPGKLRGPDGELEDRTEPEPVRRWAEELAATL